MNGKLIIIAAGCVLAQGNARADEPGNGDLVGVNARYLFAPVGFDDNDEAEVVVDGYLPSGCYKLTEPEITVDKDLKIVTVAPKARYYNVPCIEMLVPYFFTAKLGQLDHGGYKVEVIGPTTQLSDDLPVKHAIGPSPDDFNYAPVDDAKVEKDPATGALTAVLRGRFTNTCMAWDKAIVEDNVKTVNILPILAPIPDHDCAATEVPFEQRIALPATLTPGRRLLHVRSLNGQAVNHLFFK